nr:endonuclease domain-containing protein [uncultured Fluviicola sp.]
MKKFSHNHYNPKLKEYARELRTETVSKTEKRIWKGLLSRKQTGERFLRQRPIYHFIVDFFAPEIGLIIEIDGNSHINKGDYDRMRQDKLESLGYTMIRFSEGDVINNLGDVITHIQHAVHVLRSRDCVSPGDNATLPVPTLKKGQL